MPDVSLININNTDINIKDATARKAVTDEVAARKAADAAYVGDNQTSTVTGDYTVTAGDIAETADNVTIHGKQSVLIDSDGKYTEDIAGDRKIDAANNEETYTGTHSEHVSGAVTKAYDNNVTESVDGTYSCIVTGQITETHSASRTVTGTNDAESMTGIKSISARDIRLTATNDDGAITYSKPVKNGRIVSVPVKDTDGSVYNVLCEGSQLGGVGVALNSTVLSVSGFYREITTPYEDEKIQYRLQGGCATPNGILFVRYVNNATCMLREVSTAGAIIRDSASLGNLIGHGNDLTYHNGKIYVAGIENNAIVEIDYLTLTVSRTINTGVPLQGIQSYKGKMYAYSWEETGKDPLYIVDDSTLSLTKIADTNIGYSSMFPQGMTADDDNLFFVFGNPNIMLIYDIDALTFTGSVRVDFRHFYCTHFEGEFYTYKNGVWYAGGCHFYREYTLNIIADGSFAGDNYKYFDTDLQPAGNERICYCDTTNANTYPAGTENSPFKYWEEAVIAYSEASDIGLVVALKTGQKHPGGRVYNYPSIMFITWGDGTAEIGSVFLQNCGNAAFINTIIFKDYWGDFIRVIEARYCGIVKLNAQVQTAAEYTFLWARFTAIVLACYINTTTINCRFEFSPLFTSATYEDKITYDTSGSIGRAIKYIGTDISS